MKGDPFRIAINVHFRLDLLLRTRQSFGATSCRSLNIEE